MRIGTPSCAPSRHWKSPTAIATRYDDIFGDVANFTVCCVTAGPGVSDSTLPFEMAVSPRLMMSVILNVALNAGSSKHGKPRLASGGSHCVYAQPPALPQFTKDTSEPYAVPPL